MKLNAERAAEEARGIVRWLRPEFQAQAARRAPGAPGEQTEIDTEEPAVANVSPGAASAGSRTAWAAALPEQIRRVADTVGAAPQGL
ncbi:MAG: hypothetical protein ACK5YJ_00030, partial [Curvibacter sp.]